MPAIFFALISHLGWAIGDVLGTIATRKIGTYSTTFWYLAFETILFSPFVFIYWDKLQNLTFGLLILNVAIGLFGTVGFIPFYEGLRIGNASLVGTISSSFAALTVVFSIVFLNESITLIQILAILIIFIGVTIASLNFKELKLKTFFTDRGVLFALLAAICWGIFYTFIKIPAKSLGWFWPNFITSTSIPIILIYMKLRGIKLTKPTAKGNLTILALIAILQGGGVYSFNYAINHGLTSIVAPIAGSYPALFAVLAYFIFKDPITRQQVAGIIITLVGIVLLSIFSS